MGDVVRELFKYAETDYLVGIRAIVKENPAIQVTTIKDDIQQTMLHVAAGFGKTNVASYLIGKKADVNAQDIGGLTPLHNACCHGHYKTSSLLLKAGANVNLTDMKGWSPLHFAVARKHNATEIKARYRKVINLLIEEGADPYLRSTSGRDCLARIHNIEDRNFIRVTHFFELVKIGDESENLEVLRLLSTPDLINSRLESCDNITPLHRAAGRNHLETAKLFIQRGARVDAVDNGNRIPLHNAARYGHIEMIQLLIDYNSDVNKQDYEGLCPLHVAALHNKTSDACVRLKELGANVNLKNNIGENPYDLASEKVRECLRPKKLEVAPSTSDQGIYIDIRAEAIETRREESPRDELMLDSSSDRRLFSNTRYMIKMKMLNENEWDYQCVKKRMMDTIMTHTSDCGGLFTSYNIISIERILLEKVWCKYRQMCQRFEEDYGSKNEKLLFHGSNNIDSIQIHGFDERYAQRNGMFGAGIYFAEHSSKSNQYTFGWGQGCQEHKDKSCYKCERKMILAQVALGKSFVSEEAMPDRAHAPPGYRSVTGLPNITDNLIYPEYVIYNADQAYPLFVITYRIKL